MKKKEIEGKGSGAFGVIIPRRLPIHWIIPKSVFIIFIVLRIHSMTIFKRWKFTNSLLSVFLKRKIHFLVFPYVTLIVKPGDQASRLRSNETHRYNFCSRAMIPRAIDSKKNSSPAQNCSLWTRINRPFAIFQITTRIWFAAFDFAEQTASAWRIPLPRNESQN